MVLNVLSLMAMTAVKTAVIFLFLLFGFRLVGKRQLGQMNIYDLAMIMLLANAVQNSLNHALPNLSVGIASAVTLLCMGLLATYLVVRKPILGQVVTGTPTILVTKGKLMRRNLNREGVTEQELFSAMREHEISSLEKVKLAVLELDGSISIITVS